MHGHFEQRSFSLFGDVFRIILIGRRSRLFAGTRYLKRGVSDQGFVANDVETEQMLELERIEGLKVTSIVQMRGSIPLFWSQDTSFSNPKPDIIVQLYDPTYQATVKHFQDLIER